jgi:hypothetical protein
MSSKLAGEIAKIIEEAAEQGRSADPETLGRVAAQLARGFKVGNDEIAILALAASGKFLVFRYPEKLQNIGQIPMTSTTALAVRTARERRPEVINNFAIVRHTTVFEAVPLGDDPSDPIQKIMSVPILDGSHRTVGVLQICRKGRSLASAGADFTPKDLSELAAIGRLLAPCTELEPRA